MKNNRYRFSLLAGALLSLSAAILPAAAADIKVNSRMSYYTSEKEAEIMIYLPEGTGKALLDQTSYPLHQGVNLLSVNMQHLQPGNNERSVTVDYQGKSQEYKVNLLRLAPSDNEVKIDYSTGGLQVDGYPFLPTGFYSSLQGHNYPFLKSEVTQCINLYSPYHNIEPENHDVRMKYLDLCAQLGIKVNYNVSGLSAIKGGSNTHSTASEEERFRLLREEIMRVKDHPAILSYYIADEPDGQGVSPESLERAYNLIHEVDPYHPISVVIISSLPARRYEHTYDILMADPYPIPNAPAAEAPRMIQEIYDQMRYEKAVWLVPQVFGGGEIWTREPSAREVRAMCYGSILAGARGIQGFHRMPDSGSPLLWNGFKEVAVELQQIAPYLYDAQSCEIPTGSEQVKARVYRHNGKLLVVAQNMENRPCNVQLTLPEAAPQSCTARVIFETRELTADGRLLKDMLPAFGTGVYKITLEEPVSKVVRGNLMVNPSFEESAEAGEVTGGSGGAGGNGATLLPDTRMAFDGETSLRLTNPYPNAGASRGLFPIDNESDRTYILSVWAKADRRSLKQHQEKGEKMQFRLALGSLGEQTFELTDEWKRYELVCKPKEYKRTHHGGAAGSITLLSAGTAWFDLVQITPEIHIQADRTPDRHGFNVSMDCYLQGGEIHYTTDGSEPTLSSTKYEKPFEVRSVQEIKARVFVAEKAYPVLTKKIAAHKALDAKVIYQQPYHPKYNAGGDGAMTDGIFAPMNAQAPLWHGYFKNDMDVIVDLKEEQKIRKVELGFMQSLTAWVMPPKMLEVWISSDGENYRKAGKINYGEARKGAGEYDYIRIPFVIDKINKKARYIRIKATHPQTLPSWHHVMGESWMFIDEIVVE